MAESLKIDFSFIDDQAVRALLEEYYLQARNAFEGRAYIGALVASGSVAEGLLTWVLLSKENDALASKRAPKDKASGQPKPLKSWYLTELISISCELGMLGRTAEKAAWALKDFRNFIHPYNVLQQSARADKTLALNGLTAVGEIARSVKGRLPR